MDLSALADLPGVTPLGSGKVRELFAVGEDLLLLVASDRLSAYDVIMPTPIPDKGAVLTGITAFWLRKQLVGVVPNHLLSTDPTVYPSGLAAFAEVLRGRSMLVRRARPLPIECVARGYLAGSGWREYQTSRSVCGVRLPDGLLQCAELPEVIFTPATKAEQGRHDENISFARAVEIVGEDLATRCRDLTAELYRRAAAHAADQGIIVADTKFEFGLIDDELVLIDEVLTPDSSRFWPADGYQPGRPQRSFDKQFVRDWLRSLPDWDFEPPGPPLPPDVVAQTRDRYVEAFERLTGRSFDAWPEYDWA